MDESKEYLEFDEPESPSKYGNCPECGCPMNDDNYGGNGYCAECAPNH
jgi:hypothetical protein